MRLINWTNEILFWLHLGLLIFALMSGLFLPLPLIILLIIFHRVHVWVFGGCLFSRLQEKLGGIPRQKSFIQVAAKKLFDLKISQQQSHILDYSLAVATFTLASTNQIFG